MTHDDEKLCGECWIRYNDPLCRCGNAEGRARGRVIGGLCLFFLGWILALVLSRAQWG